jgi:hypothetical protein
VSRLPAVGAAAIGLALLLCLGCLQSGVALLGGAREEFRRYSRAPEFNEGVERYSAWYGDSDGRILYFGLSPFWTLWWETDGDPRADLQEPGDHLIGRFDLARQRFLPPLRVRRAGPNSRSSVWDVLVHSNGRIYYTTYFEEMGWVSADGTEVRHFAGIGVGFNELIEGPGGLLYVTRYSDDPFDVDGQQFGSVAVLTPEGEPVREFRFPAEAGVFTAPKSLAVDPLTGEIWLNADVFHPQGVVSYATLRLAPDGTLLERNEAPAELQAVWFDSTGTGWFAEDREGELWLVARREGRDQGSFHLGPRRSLDFVQDLKPFGERGVVATLWSARAFLAQLTEGKPRLAEIHFDRPEECIPPRGRSLLYTATVHGQRVYATLYCGATILGAPLPAFPLVPVDPSLKRAPR